MRRHALMITLITLNIGLILIRQFVLPEATSQAIELAIQGFLQSLGFWAYLLVVGAYLVCGILLLPFLIPLNILGGAVFGPLLGTVLATIGITCSTWTSVISARYLLRRPPGTADNQGVLDRILRLADAHGTLAIIAVRFAVVIPYLVQNLALAATRLSALRITLVTAISGIPGAAVYSLLGAGLLAADQASEILLYVAVPVAIAVAMAGVALYLRRRLPGP